MLMRAFNPGLPWRIHPAWLALLPSDLRAFGLVEESGALRALPFAVGAAPAELFDARPEWRRRLEPTPGDVALCENTDHTGYASPAQKRAVHAALTAPAEGVLLATLPTGAGKSLVTQLLALEFLRRGEPRLVVAVVPTVALAIDQYHAARPLFARRGEPERVDYIAGDTDDARSRRDLLTRIRSGALSLLITGPERLVKGPVADAVLACAASQGLGGLVVDEAHLITGWGGRFRPAFQQVAEQRRKLLAVAPQAFPTVLLSATVTSQTALTLKELFAPAPTPFRRVDARALRSELDYVSEQVGSLHARLERTIEVLRHLPRPAIVYTTSVDDAEALFAALKSGPLAFRRIALFTGDTRGIERERVVEDWRGDRLDLVVATAAFGLGVDKPDVRAVVHATLPEGLDRFYQEAGRAGRDGFAALSCVLWNEADEKLAARNAFINVISVDKALARWETMSRGATPEPGTRARLDLALRPNYDPEAAESRGAEGTVGWNLATLLLLERCSALRIHDVDRRLDTAEITWTLPGGREELASRVETQRGAEQATNADNLKAMRSTLEDASWECLAVRLGRLYGVPTAAPCGHCPACRREGVSGQSLGPLDIPEPEWEHAPAFPALLDARLSRSLGASGLALLGYPASWLNQDGGRERLAAVLARLGCAVIVAPKDWFPVVARGAATVSRSSGLVITREEADQRNWRLGRTAAAALLRPGDSAAAFHAALSASEGRGPSAPFVMALPYELVLPGTGGRPAAHEVETSCRFDAATLAREWGL
jgi:superfamily II DNA/RNA helicase